MALDKKPLGAKLVPRGGGMLMLEESFLFCDFEGKIRWAFLALFAFPFPAFLLFNYLENPRPHQQDVLKKGQACYIFAPAAQV